MPQTNTPPDVAAALPIHGFSRCHGHIRAQLQWLAELARQVSATAPGRDPAPQALQSLRAAMFDHHGEEEKELFPAVLAASNPAEYGALRALTESLVAEHRGIEALWSELEPALEQRAGGAPVPLDQAAVAELVARYDAHARHEEERFLPRAETILARKDPSMAALGLSLHMRQQLRAAGKPREAPSPTGC